MKRGFLNINLVFFSSFYGPEIYLVLKIYMYFFCFSVIGKPTESEWPKDVSLTLTNFRDHAGTPLEDVIPEITPDAKDLLRVSQASLS